MKYMAKKTLAFLLTLIMLVNIFPVSAFAGDTVSPPLVKNNRSVPTSPVSITVQNGMSTEDLYIVYAQTDIIVNWGNQEREFYGFRKYSEGDFSCPEKLSFNGAPYDIDYDASKPIKVFLVKCNSNNNPEDVVGDNAVYNGQNYNDGTQDYLVSISPSDYTNDLPVTITIGDAGPVPHTASISHLPGSGVTNNTNQKYYIQAQVGTEWYYAEIGGNGSLGYWNNDYDTLPDEAVEGTVKLVRWDGSSYTPTNEIETSSGIYVVTGPTTLPESPNDYHFEATKRENVDIYYTTNNNNLLNGQYYALVTRNNNPIAYAQLTYNVDSPLTWIQSFTTNFSVYNTDKIEIVKYTGDSVSCENLNSVSAGNRILCQAGGQGRIDSIQFTFTYHTDNNPDTYEITSEEITDNVRVIIQNAGSETINLPGNFYISYGSNDGFAPNTLLSLNSLIGTHTFNVPNLEQFASNGKTLFVVLKRYTSSETPSTENDGKHVVWNEETTNSITENDNRYDFTWSDPVDNNGVREYTITVTRNVLPQHTAHIELPAGVDTNNLYVVFLQTTDNGSSYRFNVVPVTGSGDYSSGSTFYSWNNTSYEYDSNHRPTVYLIKTGNELNIYNVQHYQQHVIINNSLGDYGGGQAYYNGDPYWGNPDVNMVIEPDATNTQKTNVSVSASRYTARVDFYDGFGAKKDGAPSGTYTFTATDADGHSYTGTLQANGMISFVDSDSQSVTDLPEISTWVVPSSWESNYTLVSSTPTPTGGVYVFTARQPKPYSVNLTFYNAGETNPAAVAILTSNHLLTATDTNGNVYTATVAAGTLTWKNSSNNNVEILPKPASFLLDNIPLIAGSTMLEKYRLIEAADTSIDPDDGVYNIIFREPTICTTSINFGEENPTIGNLYYYIIARKNNQSIGYARITGNTPGITFVDASGNITIEDDTDFWVVKSDTMLDSTALLGDGDSLSRVLDNGMIGEYYKLSIPTEPTGTVFVFEAEKQANSFTMKYRDANGEMVDSISLEGQNYYLLGTVENEGIKFFAPLPAENNTPITFVKQNGDSISVVPHIEIELKKTENAASTIADVEAGTTVARLETADNKKYDMSYYVTPSTRNINTYDIVAQESNLENAFVVNLQKQDGREDTSPAVPANTYYAVIAGGWGNRIDYYAPINPTGSQVVISTFIDENGTDVPFASINEVDNNNEKREIRIIEYTGGGTTNITALRNAWNNCNKAPKDGNTRSGDLGMYTFTFPPAGNQGFEDEKDDANTYFVTARKKDAYLVNINTYDQDGSVLTPPDPELDNGYYLRARILTKKANVPRWPAGRLFQLHGLDHRRRFRS